MPSKELIKMFIREHTNKQSNMFNVKKEMLLKYNIPHKFATITSVLRTPSNVSILLSFCYVLLSSSVS